MYELYRCLTRLASPLMPRLLRARLARGKEDAARIGERLGHASVKRPDGRLAWIHAASVGEANTVLPLIDALLDRHPHIHLLLTTVTVTSAALMEKRLPERAIHQFAPVDTPAAVESFLSHWRPDLALWVDSEFWPNLMVGTHRRGVVMGIVNARLSERSFRRWKRAGGFIRRLLSCFSFCFAQSEGDAARLAALGLSAPIRIGNLKYDAPPLPFDEYELARLRAEAAGRPVWLAASTHPGEEAQIAQVHAALAAGGLRLLTVMVPRHASRGDEVAALLSPLKVARRSRREPVTPETDIYLADTMGELGLFYRLASVAFIGGTLVRHGGQNPLEAARLGCVVVAGPHMENFAAIASEMEREGAMVRVPDGNALAGALTQLFLGGGNRAQLAALAQAHVRSQEGTLAAVTEQLQRYLAPAKA